MKRRIRHFTPSWFSCTMGTGITSILLHELPYQFKGLKNVANVIFVFNIVLFLAILGMSCARYILYPSLWKAMIFHPSQSLFLGTFSMGFSTIVNMMVLSVSPAFGHRWVILAWVLWWINVVISVAISIGLPIVMFLYQKHTFADISGIWLLPVVSTIVTAASGGIVATILPPSHARLTVYVSYILWGTGFPLAFLLMALYFARLAIHKPPPAAQIVSSFLPLGPCGQGAFALLKLSSVLLDLSRTPDGLGVGSLSIEEGKVAALAIYACTIPVALVIWGLGLFWLVQAVGTIVHLAVKTTLPFNMGWWAFTFPLGVFATSTTALAKELNSPTFRVLGTILSCAVVALWLIVMGLTIWKAWIGTLFVAPCLAEVVPMKAEEEKRGRRGGEVSKV
ncbi:voltage-dependent anion channel [Mrakia frigida]|uniref:TDT family transporter n=1 Tax=Mrakia frigida TaxID=29902 RepID=UPI003FCBFE2D